MKNKIKFCLIRWILTLDKVDDFGSEPKIFGPSVLSFWLRAYEKVLQHPKLRSIQFVCILIVLESHFLSSVNLSRENDSLISYLRYGCEVIIGNPRSA